MVNEFELLRNMRGEVPEDMDVRGVERRLTELRAGASSSSPVGASSSPVGASSSPPPRRGSVFRLALAGAGVLAMAAAAVVVIGQVPGGGEGQPGPSAAALQPRQVSAAVVLERAALVADRSTATDIRPDQWFYLKESQRMHGGGPTFESWDRMDGTRSAIREEGKKLKVGAAEKGPTFAGRTQKEIEALPTDPDALLRHFRGLERALTPLSICEPKCAPEIADDVKTFWAIGWYMKYGAMIPPDTAAAMYRALGKIPNVSIEENATDMDGRKGIGVVFDAGGGVKGYYILDPRDYHYMGTKVTDSQGQTVGMSVLGSGIVDEPGQVP